MADYLKKYIVEEHIAAYCKYDWQLMLVSILDGQKSMKYTPFICEL